MNKKKNLSKVSNGVRNLLLRNNFQIFRTILKLMMTSGVKTKKKTNQKLILLID